MSDSNLYSFIWSVADLLRGNYKQSEYGKVIWPFTVLRHLDCVLEPLESEVLKQQATNNTKEQFVSSPDFKNELLNAIMGALEAHTVMSTQALGSEAVRTGLKDVLLNQAGQD